MEKFNYLEKMVFKPDYVVSYNEDGTYTGKVLNNFVYSVREKQPYEGGVFYTNGYAASKSHPSTPVLINIQIFSNNKLASEDKNIKVYKLNHETFVKEQYKGKHDLFIYVDIQKAILAGKEMALYNEADEYVNMCKEAADPIIDKISSIINNPLYRRMGQGVMELLTQEFEKHKSNFEPTINNVKDTAKNTYDKAKNTVKTGVDKLFNEIKMANESKEPFWCETEQCTIYKELTTKYAVCLKHRGHKYSITIFNLAIGSEKFYNITQEIFHNIYAILNTTEHNSKDKEYVGQMMYNSIIDILKEDNCTEENHKNTNTTKAVKNKPIQFVEFHDEDTVESSNLFKRKFNIGDKVIVNDKIRVKYREYLHHVGTVVNISSTGNKTIYVVKFSNSTSTEIIDFYSNELDKYIQAKKTYEEPKVEIQYNNQSSKYNDLAQRMDEHDKMFNKMFNILSDIKNSIKQ